MQRLFRPLLLLLPLAFAPSLAWAQDDEELGDEDLLEESEEDKKAREEAEKKRMDEGDDLDLLDDEEELDQLDDLDMDEEEEGDDLLGLEEEIGRDSIGGEGEDNAGIYRDYAEEVSRYIPDEEMLAWERYLDKYPNTLFLDRIEKRLEALEEMLYQQRIETDEPVRLDADKRELRFAQGLLMENLNPRTRLQAGFEWGLPNYMNLLVDYEYQVRRNLSFHGGARRRYTGWSLETGTRWAFVKSSRTRTIVALIGDLHLNADPAFLGLRPQLGVGKRFGNFDAQAQAGVELENRSDAGLRVIGGANVTYAASDRVSVFTETNLHMKNVAWADGGSFRFNILSFGMKFYPSVGNLEDGQIEINLGASAPYTSNYWMFHFGSIMGQLNYYM